MGSASGLKTVVIGSGFGASVAAYRLAEAGEAVCVLERGKAYPPGSFPRTPHDMSRAMWDPSEGLHGLYDSWAFKHLDALVASGLGGGSLIYANVLLRKDPEWFTDPDPTGSGYRPWPISYADLAPHYDNVESMLMPATLPRAAGAPYELDKTRVFQTAAMRAGLDWQPVPLAVRFSNIDKPPVPGEELTPAPYGNIHNRPRLTCRLCGECDIGCNDGAKNTLDHTYLSAAEHAGAVIRTRCEVRDISRRSDGRFDVTYVEHAPAHEGQPTKTSALPLVTTIADRVVLGAGSLGSTYLLMKNRAKLPGLSAALGTRMSGNGDFLGFLLNAKEADGSPRLVRGERGPVITSTVRVDDGDIGAYIQDAGFPAFMAWMIENGRPTSAARRVASVVWRRLLSMLRRDWNPQLGADLRHLLGSAASSSTSMPLLGMGRDVADGEYGLRKGRLTCDWKLDRSTAHFARAESTMKAIAGAANADYAANPSWLFRRVVTVHPLGGCPIGESPVDSVVDPTGQAHGEPGLWVVDGAALPGPVGPNPSLTIAAFADRAAERMLHQ